MIKGRGFGVFGDGRYRLFGLLILVSGAGDSSLCLHPKVPSTLVSTVELRR